MPAPFVVQGVRIPRLVYGTAWKEERTAPLVRAALGAGFRGIDTANQRKHYHEAAVGEALREALAAGGTAGVRRDDLFLQTKFTHRRGQDHRLPYDPAAPVSEQVAASFESSLAHLGVDRLDAYVLHGPSSPRGLADADWEAWRAMERIHAAGKARLLGVSNVTTAQLRELWEGASVRPSIVQDRTLAMPQADLPTRAFCRENGLAYQGFSLLTAAPQLLAHPAVRAVADRTGLPAASALLRLWGEMGMVVLTGTTDPAHMAQDVAAFEVGLEPGEAEAFARLVGRPGPPGDRSA